VTSEKKVNDSIIEVDFIFYKQFLVKHRFRINTMRKGGSVAKWLACWTQAQNGPGSNRSATLSGDSLRQTVHTHCASVYQAAKLVAALLRVAGVTAESNGSLPPGL